MAAPTAGRSDSGGLARWLRVIPLLAGLGWAGAAAIMAAHADGLLKSAAAAAASWVDLRTPPSSAAFDSVRATLIRAANLDGRNPAAHEMLGVLGASRVDRADYREEGMRYLRQSLALRPTSPQLWAAFARASYDAGEAGSEFRTALAHSARLGPNEPEVQRIVVSYGLAVWDEVDPGLRGAIDLMVGAAARRDPAETLRMARSRGRLDVASRHLAGVVPPAAACGPQPCRTETTP